MTGAELSHLLLLENNANESSAFVSTFNHILLDHKFHESPLTSLKYWLIAFLISIPSVGNRNYPEIVSFYYKARADAITVVVALKENGENELKCFSFILNGTSDLDLRLSLYELKNMKYDSFGKSTLSDKNYHFFEYVFQLGYDADRITKTFKMTRTLEGIPQKKSKSSMERFMKITDQAGSNDYDYLIMPRMRSITTEFFNFAESLNNTENLIDIIINYFANPTMQHSFDKVFLKMTTESILRSIHSISLGHFTKTLSIDSKTFLDFDGNLRQLVLYVKNASYFAVPTIFDVETILNGRTPKSSQVFVPKTTDYDVNSFLAVNLFCDNASTCMWRLKQVPVKKNGNALKLNIGFPWKFDMTFSLLNRLKDTVSPLIKDGIGLGILMTGYLIGNNERDYGFMTKLLLAPNSTSENYYTFAFIIDDFALLINVVDDVSYQQNSTVCTTFRIGDYQPSFTQVVNIIRKGNMGVKQLDTFVGMPNEFVRGYWISMQNHIHHTTGTNAPSSTRTAHILNPGSTFTFPMSIMFTTCNLCLITSISQLPRVYKNALELNALIKATLLQTDGVYLLTNTDMIVFKLSDGNYGSFQIQHSSYNETNWKRLIESMQTTAKQAKSDNIDKILVATVFIEDLEVPMKSTGCYPYPGALNDTICFHHSGMSNTSSVEDRVYKYNSILEITRNRHAVIGVPKLTNRLFQKRPIARFSKDGHECRLIGGIRKFLLYSRLASNVKAFVLEKSRDLKFIPSNRFIGDSKDDHVVVLTGELVQDTQDVFFEPRISFIALSRQLEPWVNHDYLHIVPYLTRYRSKNLTDDKFNYIEQMPEIEMKWTLQAKLIDKIYSSIFALGSFKEVTMPQIDATFTCTHVEELFASFPISGCRVEKFSILQHNMIDMTRKKESCYPDRIPMLHDDLVQENFACEELHGMSNQKQRDSIPTDGMIMVSNQKQHDHNTTVVFTFDGADSVRTHLEKPAIVILGEEIKSVITGNLDDVIVLQNVVNVYGFINAQKGQDTIVLQMPNEDHESAVSIETHTESVLTIYSTSRNRKLIVLNVNHLNGVADKPDNMVLTCGLETVRLRRGNPKMYDTIEVDSHGCSHKITIIVDQYTKIKHMTGNANLTYQIERGPIEMEYEKLNNQEKQGHVEFISDFFELTSVEVNWNTGSNSYNMSFSLKNHADRVEIKNVNALTRIYFQDGFELKMLAGKVMALRDCSIPNESYQYLKLPENLSKALHENDIFVISRCPSESTVVHTGLNIVHNNKYFTLFENNPMKKTVIMPQPFAHHCVYKIREHCTSYRNIDCSMSETEIDLNANKKPSIIDLVSLTTKFEKSGHVARMELTNDDKGKVINVNIIASTNNKAIKVARIHIITDEDIGKSVIVATSNNLYRINKNFVLETAKFNNGTFLVTERYGIKHAQSERNQRNTCTSSDHYDISEM